MSEIKLTEKDKKILPTIEVDGGLSYSEIGKKVGLTKQVVKYRMDLMEKEDIIQEYYAIINDSKIGMNIYSIHLELTSLSEEDEKKLISNLKKSKNILSYFSVVGEWDLTIALYAKDNAELDKIIPKILNPINDEIKNKIITIQLEFDYIPTKIFSGLGKKTTNSSLEEKEKYDEIDLKIISKLMENGRKTLVDLGEMFGMSANGIKERIKILRKKGIILGFKTKINYEKLGFLHAHFFVWFSNSNKEIIQRLKNFLKEDGKTETISRFMGYSDIEFRCNLESVGELYQLKKKLKNKFKEEISSIKSVIVVRSGISHLD